jgi:hypothetical protein
MCVIASSVVSGVAEYTAEASALAEAVEMVAILVEDDTSLIIVCVACDIVSVACAIASVTALMASNVACDTVSKDKTVSNAPAAADVSGIASMVVGFAVW